MMWSCLLTTSIQLFASDLDLNKSECSSSPTSSNDRVVEEKRERSSGSMDIKFSFDVPLTIRPSICCRHWPQYHDEELHWSGFVLEEEDDTEGVQGQGSLASLAGILGLACSQAWGCSWTSSGAGSIDEGRRWRLCTAPAWPAAAAADYGPTSWCPESWQEMTSLPQFYCH